MGFGSEMSDDRPKLSMSVYDDDVAIVAGSCRSTQTMLEALTLRFRASRERS